MQQLWLIIFWNVLGLILALIFGVGFYKKKKKEVSQISAEIWGTSVFIGIMIFFNGIIVYTNYANDQREKSAFKEMKKSYQDEGSPNQESFENLKLTIRTYGLKSKYYAVYVANFNDEVSFNGKVSVKIKDDNETVDEFTSEKITIKPGEKIKVESFNGPRFYDEYSWKWIGVLK